MRIAAIKEMGVFRRQLKFWQSIALSLGRSIIGKLALGQAVHARLAKVRFAWRWTMERIGQNADSPVQFIVNLTKLPGALKLIGRETKPRQHDHENQPIPKLQTPLDGFENFHSMQ
jgi:hypothetical protein